MIEVGFLETRMQAIHIRRKLDSDTPYLPELRPFIGKSVEIIVLEEPAQDIQPATGDWTVAAQAARELRESGYDVEACQQQRDYDLKHAHSHWL